MQHHLASEMAELQSVMTPLMRRITQEMGMGGAGGFNGMGGFGMEGMEGYGEGGDDDMFGGLSSTQMQQLQ